MRNRKYVLLVVFLALLLSSVANAAPVAKEPYLDPVVISDLEQKNEAPVIVEVYPSDNLNDKANIRDLLRVAEIESSAAGKNRKLLEEVIGGELKGKKITHRGVFQDWFATTIDRKILNLLSKNPKIKAIYSNRPIAFGVLSESVPLINADKTRLAGATGAGQTICVVDSGINYTHPALGGCNRTTNITSANCTKVVDGYDFVNNDADPMDEFGHGTCSTRLPLHHNLHVPFYQL